MKKVLIISFVFLDQEGIGSVRIRALTKILPEFGWSPVILTIKIPGKHESEIRIIETIYEDKLNKMKKNFGFKSDVAVKEQLGISTYSSKKSLIDYIYFIWQEIFAYPEIETSWFKNAIIAGSNLLEKEKFDVIISSSPSVTCHLIAKELKHKYSRPWIADFRDLWTQNHYYSHTKIRTLIERKLEIKTINSADALVTISPYLVEKLKDLHKMKIHCITNGFTDKEINRNNVNLTKKFSITYTGGLYQAKRDPKKLFQVVNELITEKIINPCDIEIRFYGKKESWLDEEIKSFNLEKIAKWYGFVNRNTALEKQMESQILLILLWDHPDEKNIATGKLFDYLGSKRPIIAIGGVKGFVQEILDETNTGSFVTSNDEIKNFLITSYQQWKRTGKVIYNGKTTSLNKYSHREMVRKFSEILDDITNSPK